jgi:UrcA family protein
MTLIARTIAATAALAALTAAPALAQPETFVFRVAENQLTNRADAERAYVRLTEEAARYCRALEISAPATLAECRIDVVENVVEAVGDDDLAAIHRQQRRERTLAQAG